MQPGQNVGTNISNKNQVPTGSHFGRCSNSFEISGVWVQWERKDEELWVLFKNSEQFGHEAVNDTLRSGPGSCWEGETEIEWQENHPDVDIWRDELEQEEWIKNLIKNINKSQALGALSLQGQSRFIRSPLVTPRAHLLKRTCKENHENSGF